MSIQTESCEAIDTPKSLVPWHHLSCTDPITHDFEEGQPTPTVPHNTAGFSRSQSPNSRNVRMQGVRTFEGCQQQAMTLHDPDRSDPATRPLRRMYSNSELELSRLNATYSASSGHVHSGRNTPMSFVPVSATPTQPLPSALQQQQQQQQQQQSLPGSGNRSPVCRSPVPMFPPPASLVSTSRGASVSADPPAGKQSGRAMSHDIDYTFFHPASTMVDAALTAADPPSSAGSASTSPERRRLKKSASFAPEHHSDVIRHSFGRLPVKEDLSHKEAAEKLRQAIHSAPSLFFSTLSIASQIKDRAQVSTPQLISGQLYNPNSAKWRDMGK